MGPLLCDLVRVRGRGGGWTGSETSRVRGEGVHLTPDTTFSGWKVS